MFTRASPEIFASTKWNKLLTCENVPFPFLSNESNIHLRNNLASASSVKIGIDRLIYMSSFDWLCKYIFILYISASSICITEVILSNRYITLCFFWNAYSKRDKLCDVQINFILYLLVYSSIKSSNLFWKAGCKVASISSTKRMLSVWCCESIFS